MQIPNPGPATAEVGRRASCAACLRIRNDSTYWEASIATETNPFARVTRMMQEFTVPGLDMASVIESRRKDMNALVAANEAAYEAMQSLMRKQTEIVTEAIQGIQESATALIAGGANAADPARQTALVSDAY